MTAFFDARIPPEASHPNGFSGSVIERWSEARDEASLASALVDPGAGLYLFLEEAPLVQILGDARQPIFTLAAAQAAGLDPDSLVLLGVAPEGPRFAGLVHPRLDEREGIETADLRGLAVSGAVPARDLAALAQARSYLFWHSANRFCGRCGGGSLPVRGGGGRVCQNCGTEHFPRVDPVVIMLAVHGDRCLLGRQPRFAPGMYSALAGFLEPGETIEEAVRRETKEEAGIHIGRVRYHSSQAWPFPSSLMIGCHAEALSDTVERDAAELEDCRWFQRSEAQLMLAGTHPQGLIAPPRMAIAHQLVAAFADWEG
jgi:NAD+ diphosphatase